MVQTVWLIAEQGMDRILVQTTEPSSYQRSAMRPSRILKADIEIPDTMMVDGKVQVTAVEQKQGG